MTEARAPFVLFDHGPGGAEAVFEGAEAIIRADTPAQVPEAFVALAHAQAAGKWLAGYVSYEFGYVTSPKLEPLMPDGRTLPLMLFGVFDGPVAPTEQPHAPATLAPIEPVWDAARYAQAFDVVHDYIGAGDIYQVNLTFPMTTRSTASPQALYGALRRRQSVPHGALVDLGGPVLLSRSPELFFSVSSDGTLTTRPMKGTAPRGTTEAQDDHNRDTLQNSEKNRAENLMIVDLLRNDMSRVSQIGSVKVPDLFVVERFATLHQMTSTVTSKLIAGTSLFDLFMALFPCGSITGAPKVRAMQIIREVEPAPRDAYCGCIGWIAPDGAMEFSVAIRTLMFEGGDVRLNVGGGVVYDSTAQSEYDEALLKGRFAELGEDGA